MRTSLNSIQDAEGFLLSSMAPAEKILFRARMILDPVLRKNTLAQRNAYALIRLYGRKTLRQEIRSIEARVLHDPAHAGLRDQLRQIFKH